MSTLDELEELTRGKTWCRLGDGLKKLAVFPKQFVLEVSTEALLTLSLFSMLMSQPSKPKQWLIWTSLSATLRYDSSSFRKSSHIAAPFIHSVMKVPVDHSSLTFQDKNIYHFSFCQHTPFLLVYPTFKIYDAISDVLNWVWFCFIETFRSPITMTPCLCAALVHTAGGIVTRWCEK